MVWDGGFSFVESNPHTLPKDRSDKGKAGGDGLLSVGNGVVEKEDAPRPSSYLTPPCSTHGQEEIFVCLAEAKEETSVHGRGRKVNEELEV